MQKDYSDIINLQRPPSKKHPPMEKSMRAAQFAPFAALTGFDDAIEDTAELIAQKMLLADQNEKAEEY